MNVTTAVQGVKKIQAALKVLAALQLTSYLWPQQAVIQDGASFDFIIVGAGSAGSVIASRLTEIDTATVLLVEAGGDPPLESVMPGIFQFLKNSEVDWNYTAESDSYTHQFHKNHSIELTRGKMLGGCSSNNFMIYTRGNWHDYDNWAELTGDDTWRWDNVLPYFRKSERLEDPIILSSPAAYYYGTKGNLGVTRNHNQEVVKYLQAFEEAGNKIVLDTNGNNSLGYTELLVTISGGRRQSTAHSFLIPAKDRPNLFVLKNTLVSKIIFDENKNAIGIEAILQDNTTATYKANKEVIISAGAFNTPQLLMLSGIGPAEHLKSFGIKVISDLPVGQSLQDHGVIVFAHKMGKTTPPKPFDPTAFPVPQILGFASLNKTKTYPDYETINFVLKDLTRMLVFCSFYHSFKDEICQALYDGSKDHEVLFSHLFLLYPDSQGKIHLRSTDPKDKPLIHLEYYSNDSELEKHAKYIKDFLRVQDTKYFKSVGAKLIVPEICGCGDQSSNKDYWKCYTLCMTATGYHYAGSCPMGSVVDSNLRVHGVQRLRVADASVMPAITGANTNAPTIMIGEKVSDLIKVKHYFKLV